MVHVLECQYALTVSKCAGETKSPSCGQAINCSGAITAMLLLHAKAVCQLAVGSLRELLES